MFNKVLIEDYLRLIHNSGSIGTVTLRHIGCAFVFFGALGVSDVGGEWKCQTEFSYKSFILIVR